MESYLATILTATAVCTLGALLAPEGKSGKAIRFALSLLTLLTLLAPLRNLQPEDLLPDFSIPDGSGLPDTDTAYTETLRLGIENGLREALAEEFGLSRDCITVSADVTFGAEPEIHATTVRLTGTAMLADLPGIRREMERWTGADCTVILGEQKEAAA